MRPFYANIFVWSCDVSSVRQAEIRQIRQRDLR
jgi:hypothetical protein